MDIGPRYPELAGGDAGLYITLNNLPQKFFCAPHLAKLACVCFQRVADSRETLGDGMVLYCTEVHSLSDFQHMLSGLDETVRAHVSAYCHL